MPVPCELLPRLDATPGQLKQLGAALETWVRRELGNEGVLYSFREPAPGDSGRIGG